MFWRSVLIALLFGISPLLANHKKVLILSAQVGAGHAMAATAMTEILEPDFSCKTINIVEAVTEPVDLLYTMTNGKLSSSKVLAKMAQKNWNRTINVVGKQFAHPLFFKPHWKTFEDHAYKIFQEENPDLIISVVPILNFPFAAAAQRLNKPYILSVLDADYTMWMKGVKNIDYNKFRLIVPFAPSGKPRTATYVPDNVRHQTLEWGIPLRKAMTKPFNKKAFKKKWHFAENKPNLLLMMGGQSSESLLVFVKSLSVMPRDYHVFVFTGNNESLDQEVQKAVEHSQRVTFEVVPFTPEVPYFLRSADLLISKAGGLTCAEALTAPLFTLFNNTKAQLFWERAFMNKIVKVGYGRALRSMNQLDNAIRDCLKRKPSVDTSFREKELLFNKRFVTLARTLATA